MSRKKKIIVQSSWKGIAYIRKNAEKVNHTQATVQAFTIFALASNRSKIFRQLLHPVLPEPKNVAIRYRLQNVFAEWLRTGPLNETEPVNNISFFTGFSFNEEYELKQFIKFESSVSRIAGGHLQVEITAFDPLSQVKAPRGTKQVNFIFAVASVGMADASTQDYIQTELLIAYAGGMLPAQTISLPLETAPGKLSVVTMGLQYFNGNNIPLGADQLAWKPCGIIGSLYQCV